MDPGPPTQLRPQNAKRKIDWLGLPTTQNDDFALSAIEAYKAQNLFGFVFGGPVGGPEIRWT